MSSGRNGMSDAIPRHTNDRPAPSIGPLQSLWMQLTSACNLRCRYCYAAPVGAGTRLARGQVRQILRDFAAIGGSVVIFGGGEPTIDRALPEYLRWAHRELGLRVGVATNGVSLSDELLRELRASTADVQVSVDTLDPQLFRFLCGHDRLADVLRNVDRILEIGLAPTLSMISTRQNAHELRATVEFAVERGITFLHIGKLVSTGRASCRRELEGVSLLELWDVLYPLQLRYHPHIAIDLVEDFIAPLVLGRPRTLFCGGMMHTSLEITSRGAVTSCGMLPESVVGHGNVHDEPFSSIVARFLAGDSRSYFDAARLVECECCPARPACGGGCRAIACAATGDPYGQHPYCSDVREIHRRLLLDIASGRLAEYSAFLSSISDTPVENSRLF
jgi:radical SAM protein with 4Fe4S-binding SPASM domain